MIRFIHIFLAFLALFAGNAQAVEIGRQIKLEAERPKPIVAPSAIAHLGARQPSGAAFAVPPLPPENRTGQRSGIDQSNGVATRYSYDLMGRLSGLSHSKASQILASYTYSLRADGRRSGVTEKRLEASGVVSQTSISYTYDELNRLTQEASTSDEPGAVFQTSYSYDLCGNRLKKATAGSESIDYAYNAADQLLSENSSSKGQTTYAYDAGGNLISKNASAESAAYAYDLEGRMVTAAIARIEQGKNVTATSNYAYNLSGTRVGAVTNGNVQGQGTFSESRTFLVDEANFTGYSQVFEEFDGSGALSRSYVIGDDILSQNRGNGSETLLVDGHGSTRLLTHSSGAVMERYSFDAYGVLLGGNKGISNRAGTNYLYSGEEYDDSLQMQYLRARYYDQNTGGFNALDPYAGNMQEPQSYNKYGYCHSDPVNGIDPSGKMLLNLLVTISSWASYLSWRFPAFAILLAATRLVATTALLIGMVYALIQNPGEFVAVSNGNPAGALDEGVDGFIGASKAVATILKNWRNIDDAVEGVLVGANFAQVGCSENFTPDGSKIYSARFGSNINGIKDLVPLVKSGKIDPSNLPVSYVISGGKKVILNTRTSTVLVRAGIPRYKWFGINQTGKIAGEENGIPYTFDQLAKQQLFNNALPPWGSMWEPL